MASAPYPCTIVTPEKQVLDHEIAYANVPAWDGQIGFLINAAPVLTKLGYGNLRLDDAEGNSETFFVAGGFCQMRGDQLTILTDEIIPADQLKISEAQAAVEKAQAKRDTGHFDAEQQKRDEARASAMLKMAQQFGSN